MHVVKDLKFETERCDSNFLSGKMLMCAQLPASAVNTGALFAQGGVAGDRVAAHGVVFWQPGVRAREYVQIEHIVLGRRPFEHGCCLTADGFVGLCTLWENACTPFTSNSMVYRLFSNLK